MAEAAAEAAVMPPKSQTKSAPPPKKSKTKSTPPAKKSKSKAAVVRLIAIPLH